MYKTMSVKKVVKSIVGQLEAETVSAPDLTDVATCPEEIELLAYCENRLPEKQQVRVYRHISSCNNCIELLAMLAKINEAVDLRAEELTRQMIEASDKELEQLTDRVLKMIEEDEAKFRDSSS
jgi:anti-sigma factor RsiW